MQKLRNWQLKLFILLILGYCCSVLTWASPSSSDYVFKTTVSSKSKKEKAIAAQKGLEAILTKQTGERIPASFLSQKIETFIDAYDYNSNDEALTLSLRFNPHSVDSYLKKQGKSPWPNKPNIIVWPFFQQNNTYNLQITSDTLNLIDPIQEDSQKRGLAIFFPETSLDILEIFSSFNKPLASLSSEILHKSQPYDSAFVLVYIISPAEDNKYQLEASLFYQSSPIDAIKLTGINLQDIFSTAMDELVPQMKKLSLSFEIPKSSFFIKFDNISSPSSYSKLQAFLQNQRDIDALKLENLSESTITFKVETKLSQDNFISLMKKNEGIKLIEKQQNTLSFLFLS